MAHAIGTVAPIFALILLGLAARRLGWLSPGADKGLAEFTFVFAMPVLLFRTMVTADLGEADPRQLLTCYFAIVALNWALATAAARLLGRTGPDGAVFAMTSSYGNIVLLGIPIALSAWGSAAAATSAVIVSAHVVLLWLAASLHLALASSSTRPTAAEFARAVTVQVLRNPIVVAIVLGSLWRITGLGLHPAIDRGMSLLGQAGVPCALIAVGLSLPGFELRGERRALLAGLALKNIAMPVIAWGMTAKVFGLAPLPAAVIVLFAAMPTGTATFLFATYSGYGRDNASAAVCASTGLALLTLPLVLAWLGMP